MGGGTGVVGVEGRKAHLGSWKYNYQIVDGLTIRVLNILFLYVFADTHMSFINSTLKSAVLLCVPIHYH